MFWIELIIVLAIIFIGVRVGGTFLAMAGGIGMFIMTFILHVTPSDPPITVILIMIAVICAAATMQACGGLDYLVRIAEKILRKNPKMITVLAPVVAYIFTFMCGTGHIVYSLLPVINEIAIETGVRPERPIFLNNLSITNATRAMYPLSSIKDKKKNKVTIIGRKLNTLPTPLKMPSITRLCTALFTCATVIAEPTASEILSMPNSKMP